MNALADQLENKYKIRTRRLHLDLAEKESVGKILDMAKETSCRLLIYNAAYSRVKRFEEHTPEDLDAYLGVNASSPIHLVHGMLKHNAGIPEQKKGIILMASLVGLWGAQLLASYGATKAFNILLAESLHHELKAQNFDVMAPGQVAEGALEALSKKALFIPGWNNRLTYFLLTRILKRRTSTRLFNRTTGRMYPEA